ncbi:hypothetical protein CDL12_25150 [Handroanthus impetiginosus]|uniref:Protein PHLOEM PROTEIN 2-LIKE A1 n=1 Tax=Handroanthus impetiginosus TaxID=429701 RepID=A0A2G9GBI7_9LAMI|nr:hypothetical protein CDL12_25150 [Handroanthus impetiginosus]
MGARLSQDQASEPVNEQSNHDTSQISHTNTKAHQSIKEVPFPHNCEEILRHADVPVDRSSRKKLLEQLHEGVFLNQKRKKYYVEKETNHNCFILFARDLAITWSEDIRFWHWPILEESSNDERLAVAELLNVAWLEVHGRFDIANLSPGTTYEIVFIVKLTETAYGWRVPVNLRLTLPDGSRQEHKENLLEKPRERWIEIPAGEFKTSADNIGEMEFSLYE